MFRGVHQEAGNQHRGLLPQRRALPSGRVQRALGLHAGRDHHHPAGGQAGAGGEEQEQIIPDITTVGISPLFPDDQ